jgi:predicted transcriptional regulator
MFQKLFEILSLGCHHRRISKPFAAARTASASNGQWESVQSTSSGDHYVVCLECGKKFGYDWSRMKMIR